MKAMVVSPVGGRVPPTRGVLHNGLGLNGSRRDMEAEEVAAYLTKLRSLVPDMPRKRKLSKLEVIQRVIEYICDLQTTLEETNNVPEKMSHEDHDDEEELEQSEEETEEEEEMAVEQRKENEDKERQQQHLSIVATTTTSSTITTTMTTTETSSGVYER